MKGDAFAAISYLGSQEDISGFQRPEADFAAEMGRRDESVVGRPIHGVTSADFSFRRFGEFVEFGVVYRREAGGVRHRQAVRGMAPGRIPKTAILYPLQPFAVRRYRSKRMDQRNGDRGPGAVEVDRLDLTADPLDRRAVEDRPTFIDRIGSNMRRPDVAKIQLPTDACEINVNRGENILAEYARNGAGFIVDLRPVRWSDGRRGPIIGNGHYNPVSHRPFDFDDVRRRFFGAGV
ncbi:MAG: hypothetical protein ACRC1K_11430, partial [Planctomycetia bacterium]